MPGNVREGGPVDMTPYVATAKGPDHRLSFRAVRPSESNARTSITSGFTTTGILSQDDYNCTTDNGGKTGSAPTSRDADFTPCCPKTGEKPNELLQRLFSLWPSQLTSSYRPHVVGNPEATAEYNLRYIRELYPSKRKGLRRRVRAVESVMHMDRKSHYSLNLASWPRH